jgi:hypothetical protein
MGILKKVACNSFWPTDDDNADDGDIFAITVISLRDN